MSNKFKTFMEEYSNNSFWICTDLDDGTLWRLLDSTEDVLIITNTHPAFAHERLFLSELISDNFDEVYQYFEDNDAKYIAVGR